MCRVARSIHLFRIRGRLNPENVKFKKNWIWDVLEIDWSNVSITLNDNEIDLPSLVIIPFKERYRASRLLRKHPLLFYVMLKQGKTWFSLVPEPRNLSIANDNNKNSQNKTFRQDAIILYSIFLENMARSLNSRCDFKNGFFTCDLPGDAVLLTLKVKTKTSNHTLVEDMEKQTEKFRPLKKPIIDGKPVPQKLPEVLTPQKNDNSITSDSGPCPSLTENEYKPRFFDEPDCMSSDKENIPLTESVTPPSLKNLSLEEEANDNENEATSWEASVARNIMMTPRASSPFLK